jgi:hypothetical protein
MPLTLRTRGQTEMALAPLSFSPVRSGEPAREVSNVLPMLDSVGAKMLMLEGVVSEKLEAKHRILAEKVVEYVLTCFQSWDPNASLESMVQGPTVEVEEAARASVQDAAKIMVARFPPAKRCIGLLFQILCPPEPFVTCVDINLLSICVACCS